MLHPRVVIEVLSPGTEDYDRGRKAMMYHACSTIEEYLLVNSQATQVELHRRAGAIWELHTLEPDDTVTLTSLGVSLPIAAIYRKASFAPAGPEAGA